MQLPKSIISVMQKSNTRIKGSGILFVLILVLCCNRGQSQKVNGFSVEAIGSVFFNSERHANENGDQGMYYELRFGKALNKYLDVNFGAGYQKRSFIYYAQKASVGFIPLYMDRHYVPVNASVRLYLSEFFNKDLKVWKKPGKFDVYYQLGLSTLKGKDVFDDREEDFRSQGFYVPYYLEPYVQEYGKVYITNLAGARYNFNPHFGLFIEGGDGALMTLQIGISTRF